MKNIHVLPTEKSSRFYKCIDNELSFTYIEFKQTNNFRNNQNIYITSDEKFVRDEYVTDGIEVIKANPKLVNAQGLVDRRDWKKIILTTDQDLIKDGVQAIDDEFLEWFVKHPSCEFVEVDKEEDELVSPKNPKIRFNYLQDPPSFISAESLNNMILTYKYKIIIPQEEPKQETLEEACKRIKNELDYSEFDYTSFKLGAKWQQEQDKNKYSEEEMLDFSE